jgi:hypothetical protein
MPRQKKTAHVADRLEHKLAGLKAIDPQLDLGNNCNIITLENTIVKLRDRVNAYNQALAIIDSSQVEITELERSLNKLSEQFLLGVAFQYGKDSHEYELAGGIPTRERVRKSMATRIKKSSVPALVAASPEA